MKKKKGVKIQINLSNKLVYTLIVFGILAIVAVGLYAFGGNSPSDMGHSLGEIETCGDGQTLQVSGGEWSCVDVSGGADLSGWSFSDNYFYDDGEQVIRANDEWLRLNQDGDFSSGVFTPGNLRTDGSFYIGSQAQFHSDTTYMKYDGPRRFYITDNVPVTYLYSDTTYLGSSSGDTINFRANTITGTGPITAGKIYADSIMLEGDENSVTEGENCQFVAYGKIARCQSKYVSWNVMCMCVQTAGNQVYTWVQI